MKKNTCLGTGSKYSLVLCNNIRYYREYYGYSQTALANKVGVSRNTIASVERGDSVCSVYLALLICEALHISIENLFFLEYAMDFKCYK